MIESLKSILCQLMSGTSVVKCEPLSVVHSPGEDDDRILCKGDMDRDDDVHEAGMPMHKKKGKSSRR